MQREPDAFYGGAWSPAVLQDRDVVLLVNPSEWLLNGPPAAALVQHVHAGARFARGRWSPRWRGLGGPIRRWPALMPLQVAGPAPFVPGEVLLRLSAGGRHHPVVRPPAGADDPWLRLPPLPGYFRTAQQRPGTIRTSREHRGVRRSSRRARMARARSSRPCLRLFGGST